jgi:hypothetical protein
MHRVGANRTEEATMSEPLQVAKLKAEKTYNAAADRFDAEPLVSLRVSKPLVRGAQGRDRACWDACRVSAPFGRIAEALVDVT